MATTKPTLSPAIYTRVSTADQTCQVQLADLREQIAFRKWPGAAEYVDHGFSGAKASRPAFDQLMQAALAGKHDCIMVTKIDRFGRSVPHFFESLGKLQTAGVRFIAANQGIDTDASNPMSRLMMTVLAAIAEFERELILERSAAGRARKFAEGKPDSWMLVYGYKVVNDTPVVVPAEAANVLRMFEWRAKGESIYTIIDLLHQAGAKPRRAKEFSQRTLRGYLSSRQYLGEYERGGQIFAMPATVPQDLFDRVQADFKTNAVYNRKVGQPTKLKALLPGMLYCACGRRMQAVPKGPKSPYVYYRCAGKLRKRRGGDFKMCTASRNWHAVKIDDTVWAAIWKMLQDPARFRQMAEDLAAEEDAGKPKAGRDARKQLESAKAEVERIVRMTRKGMYDEDEGAAEVKALRGKIIQLEADVRALGKLVEIAPLSRIERIFKALTEGGEPEGMDRREVLEGLVKLTARLKGNEVIISGQLPLDAPAAANAEYCADRLTGIPKTCEPIPFVLKARIAA